MSTQKKDPMSFLTKRSATPLNRLAQLTEKEGQPAVRLVPVAPGEARVDVGFQTYSETRIYEIGERIRLPVRLVIPDPLQPRAHYPEGDLISLKNSLSSEGQLTAIQVYPADEQGTFRLRSGERRTRATRALQRTLIDAEIVEKPVDTFECYRRARAINLEQRSHTHLDDAVRFKDLLAAVHGLTQQDLANQLELSASNVSKCLSVGELPKDVLELMAQNISNFGLTASHAIYRYWVKTGEDAHEVYKLAQRVIDDKLSVRMLESFVDSSVEKRGKLTRDRAISRAVFSGNIAEGELKAFDGKLTLTLSRLSDQSRTVFFQKIVALFQEQGLSVDSATPQESSK